MLKGTLGLFNELKPHSKESLFWVKSRFFKSLIKYITIISINIINEVKK